ncbi:MAG: hypothetical protein IKD78_14200, partial [Bacteroidales bacterium]|nr:hypothetical protein [Bacteroidales bacterium]
MSEETEDKVPETGEMTNNAPVTGETQAEATAAPAEATPEAQGGNTINVLEGLEPVRLRPGM